MIYSTPAPSLLSWLSSLLPRLSGLPILMLAAYRAGELAEDHPLIQRQGQAGAAYQLRLSPLSTAALHRMILELAPDLSTELRDHLGRASGGNPFFLLTLLRHWFEEGLLEATAEGKWSTATTTPLETQPLPSQFADLIERCLARLTHEERRLLRFAAVIGAHFERELLQRAWGGEDISRPLDRLIRRQLLVMEEGSSYAFSHLQIQQMIVTRLDSERRLLHLRVAEALEQLHPDDLQRYEARLAHHFAEAGQWLQALSYARTVAGRAVASHQNEEGLRLIELGMRAIEALQSVEHQDQLARDIDQDRFELLAERVTLFDRLGRREEQALALDALEQLARQMEDEERQARVSQMRAHLCLMLVRYLEGETHAQAALELRRKLGVPIQIGQALNDLGQLYWGWGKPQLAEGCYRQALECFQQAGEVLGEAASWNDLGVVQRSLGNYQESLACLKRALGKREQAGQRLEAAQTLANIGNVHWALDQVGEALDCYRQAYEVFRAVGDRRSEGKISFNIGLAYSDLKRYARALEWYERAERIFQEVGDRKAEGEALSDRGLVYADCGRYREAGDCLQRSRSLLAASEDRRAIAKVTSNLGSLYLKRGKPRKALPFFRAAYKMRRELGDRRRQGLNLSHLGAAYLVAGDARRALRYLRQALQRFEELGVTSLKVEALSRLGLAKLERGDSQAALETSREAIALLEQEGGAEGLEHPEEILFAHYQVLHTCGRPDEASIYLKRAYQEISSRARQFVDPHLKESFLTQVSLNRRITRAYEKQPGHSPR
ncbi:MAG TPA: tetratricopeptide repeat protein [Candidatus Fraserbacteria bacterium]|nr:tetratricopeptide repeat protein [Candidatus Fraserbacteria bacterium]